MTHDDAQRTPGAGEFSQSNDVAGNSHRAQFIPVRDTRNRRVPGLYQRNGRFYAQLWIDPGTGKKTARRFALNDESGGPVRSLQAAREALEISRNQRREDKLPGAGRKPTFAAYVAIYLAKASVQRKRAGTLENENQALVRWIGQLGHLRIDRIPTPVIAAYLDKRLHGGAFGLRTLGASSIRTAKLDLIAFRNVLKMATEDGHLRELPKIPRLKEPPAPKRKLLKPLELEELLQAIPAACQKNAEQLGDYLRFLAFTGAREQETLRIRWDNVDFERERVEIGADRLAKNGEARWVEFNEPLGRHLKDMHAKRAPDCSWLFPSPQRGKRDVHAKSMRESLKLARKAARLPKVGFHDLRHYFCSMCVMAGVDFMTIAAWLGHKDGGILVGKVYGHLLDEHRKQAAQKVTFAPALTRRDA